MVIGKKQKPTKEAALAFTAAMLGHGATPGVRQKPFDPTNKAALSEGVIQSSIIDYLVLLQVQGQLFFSRINNIPVWDPTNQRYRALPKGMRKGFPDIFIMMGGRAIFFELKSSTGSQSAEQVEIQTRLEEQGAEYYVIRSLDGAKRALFEGKQKGEIELSSEDGSQDRSP